MELFSDFKGIVPSINPTKEEIAKYYLDNNLSFGVDLLDNYFLNSSPQPTNENSDNQYIDIKSLLEPPNREKAVTKFDFKQDKLNLAKQSIVFFMDKGLTKEQSAGIVGNLYAESGFNTTALGDQGTSYGLAQWRLGRRDNLINFAKANNLKIEDFQTQLEFVWHELNSTHKKALELLVNSNDPKESARIFSDHYEKPKIYNVARSHYAENFYNL